MGNLEKIYYHYVSIDQPHIGFNFQISSQKFTPKFGKMQTWIGPTFSTNISQLIIVPLPF
jgi:hypothetical protein